MVLCAPMHFPRSWVILSVTMAALSACGPLPEMIQSCQLAEDQKASLMVPVPLSTTVRAKVDQSFTRHEQEAITSAVAKWNAFGGKNLGRSLFLESRFAASAVVLSEDGDACGMSGGADEFQIVRESSPERWRAWGLSDRNPAATLRCHTDGALVRQVVMVNPAYTNPAQFQSIVLHELGHALGLDHSCKEGKGNPDYAGCSKLPSTHAYVEAVMFPALKAGNGGVEVKEDLRSNDLERAFCLFRGGR